jgi:competence protein ComEC
MHEPSKILTAAFTGWLAGMVLNIFPVSLYTTATVVIVASLLMVAKRRRSQFGLIIFLFFLSANLYQTLIVRKVTPPIEFETPQQLWVTILDKPTKNNDRAKYLARAPDGWYMTLTVQRVVVIEPGTDILIQTTLQPATPTEEPAAQLRVAKNRIFAKASNPIILEQRPATLNWWERTLIKSRARFDRTIQSMFVEPGGSLFAGIVTGLKSDLPTEILDNFKVTGLSHIIAVSGFNITIVMDLFTRFSQRFGRAPNFVLSWLAIIFFIFFTGATASVVRAGILAGLFVIARTLGRKASIVRLLLITATVMTILNPLLLRYDIGFQLSFLAIIGLVVFATPIGQLLKPLHLPDWLNETMSATLAAQLTTTPIIIHYFSLLSLYSLPANIVVGPLVPLLTIFGIPLILIVSVFPFLAWLSYPFDLAVRYIIWVVDLIARLPFAQLTVPTLPPAVWLYYYATISLWAMAIDPPSQESS